MECFAAVSGGGEKVIDVQVLNDGSFGQLNQAVSGGVSKLDNCCCCCFGVSLLL